MYFVLKHTFFLQNFFSKYMLTKLLEELMSWVFSESMVTKFTRRINILSLIQTVNKIEINMSIKYIHV